MLFSSLSLAAETSLTVIYPDIGEPYREVFEKIIEGVESKSGTPVTKHAVRADTNIESLNSSLRQQNTKVVIALGRQGVQAATALDRSIGLVIGGVLSAPNNEGHPQRVISLSPDPALLFGRLKMLMPAVKRVFVVYDPNINGWLMKLAMEAAHAQGLELVAYQAQDLRTAVKFYQEIFSAVDSRKDALWLPQDRSTVEESSILPLVLEKSWNQGVAVFSSNITHVRRGVLFSLYPNNVALGKSLASLAQNFMAQNFTDSGEGGMLPLHDVQIAVNLRTAKHLGLNASRQKNFDMIFPEQ